MSLLGSIGKKGLAAEIELKYKHNVIKAKVFFPHQFLLPLEKKKTHCRFEFQLKFDLQVNQFWWEEEILFLLTYNAFVQNKKGWPWSHWVAMFRKICNI